MSSTEIPSNPTDDNDDWLFGEPEQDEIILAARRDHLRLLAHSACSELLELVRLHNKLQERGGKLGPVDCFKCIDAIADLERARLRYAHDLKRYDGPQIIFQAADKFAGRKVALVVEGFMTQWRELLWTEVLAERDRERAERGLPPL